MVAVSPARRQVLLAAGGAGASKGPGRRKRRTDTDDNPMMQAAKGVQPPYVVYEKSDPRSASPPPVTPDSPAPPIDPEDLPPKLLYQREKLYAWAMADRFHRWMILYVAWARIPLDDVLLHVENLALLVEAHLLLRVRFPDLRPDFEVDEAPVLAPETEEDAAAYGLTVHRPRRRPSKPVPNLPGCHGEAPNGLACMNLRCYGAKFCPACEAKERQRLRNFE